VNENLDKILFSGDSLTRGELGRGFIPLLRREFPNVELINLGKDGDTLTGIGKRTLNQLTDESAISGLVIEAGHNDIILSDFMNKSMVHKSIAKAYIRKGSVPAPTSTDFIKLYRDIIRNCRALTSCPLAVTTLSCISEDLKSSLNTKRRSFNEEIKKIAKDENLILLDVAQLFDSILEKSGSSSYFMDNLLKLTGADKRDSRSDQNANALSQKRGLVLTIDGIHLNSRGAFLYKKIISSYIQGIVKSK